MQFSNTGFVFGVVSQIKAPEAAATAPQVTYMQLMLSQGIEKDLYLLSLDAAKTEMKTKTNPLAAAKALGVNPSPAGAATSAAK